MENKKGNIMMTDVFLINLGVGASWKGLYSDLIVVLGKNLSVN